MVLVTTLQKYNTKERGRRRVEEIEMGEEEEKEQKEEGGGKEMRRRGRRKKRSKRREERRRKNWERRNNRRKDKGETPVSPENPSYFPSLELGVPS